MQYNGHSHANGSVNLHNQLETIVAIGSKSLKKKCFCSQTLILVFESGTKTLSELWKNLMSKYVPHNSIYNREKSKTIQMSDDKPIAKSIKAQPHNETVCHHLNIFTKPFKIMSARKGLVLLC